MELYYDEVKNVLIFQGLVDDLIIKIASKIEISLDYLEDIGIGFEIKKDYIKKEFYYENKQQKLAIFSNFGIKDLYYIEETEDSETIWFKLKNSYFRYVVVKISKKKLVLLLKRLVCVFSEKRNEKMEKKIREILKLIKDTQNIKNLNKEKLKR